MPYDLFYKKYATTAINYIRPSYHYRSEYKKSIRNLVVKIDAKSLKHGFVMVAQEDHRRKGLEPNTPYNVCHFMGTNYKNGKMLKKMSDEKYMYQREGSIELDSSQAAPGSQFIILINLEQSTDITLCTYSDQPFEYECEDGLDSMLEYIEAIAVMEELAKSVQTDSNNTFKSWLTSIGDYAFLVFKNITRQDIKVNIELSAPKNVTVRGDNKISLKIRPDEAGCIQGKITDLKQPFSFGPMRFSMG
jgi:general stress protein CsbA